MGLEYADRVIAVSNKTKDTLVKLYGIDEGKIHVVHNAVEHRTEKGAQLLDEKKEDKIVLFLGRLSIQKGADYLLKAAKRALEIMEKIKFVFVGDGDMLRDLIDLSIELGISDKIVFTGWLTNSEVDRAYRYADLFVMPSVSEPFGITALEAIRNGTPVIMSKQSGASEVITHALKVDFWDVDEMANEILAVLKHTALAKTLTEGGLRDLERINWDKQSDKVIDIYKQLI